MNVYVHMRGGDEVALVEVEANSTVKEILSRSGAPEGAEAWLQEAEQPLERAATLATLGVEERAHLHVSTCRKVAVSVRYGGDTESRDFPPAETVASVFAWATGPQGFGLTPSERAKHTLAVCDGNTELDRSAHIGSFADEDCSTCLDLAPKERFEG
jgi:hypothetical protein